MSWRNRALFKRNRALFKRKRAQNLRKINRKSRKNKKHEKNNNQKGVRKARALTLRASGVGPGGEKDKGLRPKIKAFGQE